MMILLFSNLFADHKSKFLVKHSTLGISREFFSLRWVFLLNWLKLSNLIIVRFFTICVTFNQLEEFCLKILYFYRISRFLIFKILNPVQNLSIHFFKNSDWKLQLCIFNLNNSRARNIHIWVRISIIKCNKMHKAAEVKSVHKIFFFHFLHLIFKFLWPQNNSLRIWKTTKSFQM